MADSTGGSLDLDTDPEEHLETPTLRFVVTRVYYLPCRVHVVRTTASLGTRKQEMKRRAT